jgi:cytochrome P450
LPGLLTQLISTGLDDDEIIGFVMLMCLNTIDVWTTIAFVFLALASTPQLRAVLCRDPEQIGSFVDEILRLEPPEAGGAVRMCARDTTIGDVTIPAGSVVLLRLASANREDSDDIAVADGRIVRHRHWTWGAGPHRCLGAGLVQAELTVLIREWLRRIPDFEVVPGWPPDIDALVRQVAGRGEGFRVRRLSLRWGHAVGA